MFRLIKFAAWTFMGWALYQVVKEEAPAQDGSRDSNDSDPAPAKAVKTKRAPRAAASKEAAKAPASKVAAEAPAPQDLRKIRGIGPGIAAVLNDRGITTWAQLATTEVSALESILEDAGPRYRVHDPSTWPAQAADLAKAN